MLAEDVNFWARDKGFISRSAADSWVRSLCCEFPYTVIKWTRRMLCTAVYVVAEEQSLRNPLLLQQALSKPAPCLGSSVTSLKVTSCTSNLRNGPAKGAVKALPPGIPSKVCKVHRRLPLPTKTLKMKKQDPNPISSTSCFSFFGFIFVQSVFIYTFQSSHHGMC